LLILGLESSCDETAAALVEGGAVVRSNTIASQAELHAEYGGVVPEIASRAHVERITPVIETALRQANATLSDVGAVAVANRPGLIGALLVSTAAAKALAWSLGVPLIGVDHVLAHLYAPLLLNEGQHARGVEPPTDESVFPALGLVVSGGHTALYLLRSPLDVRTIGTTIDDAIGEAYDKAAAILGLGYPGGPIVDRRAQRGDASAHDLPVSRLAKGSLDLSYSGLKTALLYAVRGTPAGTGPDGKPAYERSAQDLSEHQIDDFCASFQRAAVRAITLKLSRAFERWNELSTEDADSNPAPRSLLVGGGVAANSLLRSELEAWCVKRGVKLRLPPMPLCLDNAAMTAGLAHRLLDAGHIDDLTLAASPSGAAHTPMSREK
jgi:N6-L-threonylcarbamoyladenine synthase